MRAQRFLIAITFLSLGSLPLSAENVIDFNRDIRPILSDRCFKCHGPDANNQKSDFRLNTREHAIADLGGYRGIVPGNLDKSELHLLIRSEESDEVMPPPKSKMSLTEKEKDLLDSWIKEGAPYDQHWSLKPLPKVIPVPSATEWVRTPVDPFILRTAEEVGLTPSPEASRESWLRRVTFDLTGLPPTITEIDAFLADQSPDAFEKVVDRLLSTDAYAERMTSEWLDVARYSDTYGYQVDRDRFVWPYRDWVLRAFRDNLPYDQFATWQIAGDLLPDATRDQILATTFNRLHPQKVEGGSVPEEFRIEYVSDRLHTFGTAFLGLTMECTRCHDHKYDPITAKEYYQLSSFFANIDEAGLYSYFTKSVPTPTLGLTTPEQDKQLVKAETDIVAAEAALASVMKGSEAAFTSWLSHPGEFQWNGLLSHISFDDRNGGNLPDSVRADKPANTSGNNLSVEGVHGQGLKLTGDDPVSLKDVGDFTRTQPFGIGLWMNTPEVLDRAVVVRRSKAWTDAASRGYELLLEDGKLSAALIHFYPGNAMRIRSKETLPVGEWHHVTMTYDGSSTAAGLRLYLDGRPIATEVIRDKLTREITGGGDNNLALGQRMRDNGFKNGLVDELYIFGRELTALEAAHLHDGKSLTSLLASLGKGAKQPDKEQLRSYFLSSHKPYTDALESLRKSRDAKRGLQQAVTEIMVMEEMERPRPAYLLERGLYDARGEEVTAGTPAALPPFPKDQPNNRLGLARWLTDPAHPLTGRVTVNRYWQMFFGKGLVSTPEDFGSQGQAPSHPELLDWLARDFIDHGWDLHHLIKRITLSSTYRKSSVTDPKNREIDPENIYLARGTTTRLSAEMIRDHALATSGLLVPKFGGPPVKPYEVAVSFKPAKPDKGEGLYRRSLYTWWKRTAPAPMMMTLNATKRDVCRVHREITDSPLQAFVLLNSPQFVEAARVMADKLLAKYPDEPDALINEAFRSLTSRQPNPTESSILRSLYNEQFTIFEKEPAKATALLKTGDAQPSENFPAHQQAATTVLINAIMNFDEAVIKR
jgi:hypothetical protein